MPGITTPVIGALLTQVWKPVNAIGAASDPMAPFALGTILTATAPKDLAQFARCAGNISAGATTGITNGVTTTAGAGNTWTNETGVALVTGDYAFFTAAITTNP